MSVSRSLHYRYRLNENEELANKCVEGVHLSKDWSKPSLDRKKQLDSYIRSKVNPKGIIDFEQFIPEGGKVLKSSKESFERELRIYTIEELSLMKRDDLVEVGNAYAISSINKNNQFLIKKILEAQNQLQGKKEEVPTLTEIQKVKDLENIKKRKAK